MLLQEHQNEVVTRWSETLDQEGNGFAKVLGEGRRLVTSQLLENQAGQPVPREFAYLSESQNVNSVTGVDNWSPILISMVRRIAPRLIAYDVCGVQPMTGPTGLIFCLKARYTPSGAKPNDQTNPEAMGIDEVNAGYSGDGTPNSGDTFGPAPMVRGGGIATATAETQKFAAMGVTIEKNRSNRSWSSITCGLLS